MVWIKSKKDKTELNKRFDAIQSNLLKMVEIKLTDLKKTADDLLTMVDNTKKAEQFKKEDLNKIRDFVKSRSKI